MAKYKAVVKTDSDESLRDAIYTEVVDYSEEALESYEYADGRATTVFVTEKERTEVETTLTNLLFAGQETLESLEVVVDPS